MYLGVDVGGTKTIVATLDETGSIAASQHFPTPQDYSQFLDQFKSVYSQLKPAGGFIAGAAGIPATVLDRGSGIGVEFGNLAWENVPIKADLENIAGANLKIENDAKVAALYEARWLKDRYKRVLYITLGTGIGTALVVGGKLDLNFGDAGGRGMMIEYQGQLTPWEDFVGGRAIKAAYGQEIKDISDQSVFKEISFKLALGLSPLVGELQPDVIVFGGGASSTLDKFRGYIIEELSKDKPPKVSLPQVIEAINPKEAVIYGCFDLIKQD